MTLDPSRICFGISEEHDRKSLSIFLQLAGRKEFTELLASKMNGEEIDSLVSDFSAVLRKHLTENEYHHEFLQDDHSH